MAETQNLSATPDSLGASRGSAALAEREQDVLDELRRRFPAKWVRPMDVGGRNGSHHSYTLSKLARLGYAESRRRCVSVMGAMGSCKAGKEYRAVQPPSAKLTDAGGEERKEG